MQKKSLSVICIVVTLLIACLVFLVGCNATPENEVPTNDGTPKTFIIQYTYDAGTHQIEVTAGMPYSLDVVPSKTGYEFTGLYDAQVGGTQYISATGASLSPFTDGRNLVLFPQFKAKNYTVILDYQGAQVTGSRQLTIAYGSSLPELPKNLTGDHKEFAGWYTKTNCEGTQIADAYGLIPLVSVLNDTNFDLSSEQIYLYAGFEIEKFTVTCCFEAGMDTEEIQVEYDTPVSKIVPKTRVDGKAPLTWSKSQGGEVWNDKVTDDMVLYAVEYAPVIELDSNGGNKVNAVVARAGSTITLPTPTKDLAKFAYWEDMQGNVYTSETMPSKSISLKAVWQGKIVFDENGGSDVNDISVAAGTAITLPTPEREGFVFAGWYTQEKDLYTIERMPSNGIKLKAGWYRKIKEDIILLLDSGNEKEWAYGEGGPNSKWAYEIDLSKYIQNGKEVLIEAEIFYDVRMYASNSKRIEAGVYLYDGSIVSDLYFIGKQVDEISHSFETHKLQIKKAVKSNKLYLCLYSKVLRSTNNWLTDAVYFKNIYGSFYIPNTNNLYL